MQMISHHFWLWQLTSLCLFNFRLAKKWSDFR